MSDSDSTKAPAWVPNASIEARKLQSKSDAIPWCNMAGTAGTPVMARTLADGNKTDQQILDAGKSVLEHHFDNHCFCGDWCRRKEELLAGSMDADVEDEQAEDDGNKKKKKKTAKKKFYRSKEKDALLYDKISSIIARFITLDALKEVAHKLDTCVNESINNVITWYCPKNKVYAGTTALSSRISMAIGIHTLGYEAYFEKVFDQLGMELTPAMRHYFQIKSGFKARHQVRVKSAKYKRSRKQQHYEKLKVEMADAQSQRNKRDGVYEPGIGMNGGYTEEDLDQTNTKKKSGGSRRKKKTASNKICPHCNKAGHVRTSSKHCDYYGKPLPKRSAVAASAEDRSNASADAANAMDEADAIPLSDDSSGSDGFFDANCDFTSGSSSSERRTRCII